MIRTMTHRKYDLMIALAIGLAAGPLRAATLVVNNLGDTDVCDASTCTLRGAMNASNAMTGADAITFAITGTIGLTATLPDVTDPAGLTIDGVGSSVTIRGGNHVMILRLTGLLTIGT